MRIVYRSIISEIIEAKAIAEREHRTIERFELSSAEYDELRREAQELNVPVGVAGVMFVAGVKVVKVTKCAS